MTSQLIRLDGQLDLIPVLDTLVYSPEDQRQTFVKQVFERSSEPTCGWNVLPVRMPDETIPLYIPIETLTDSELLLQIVNWTFALDNDATPERLLSEPDLLKLIDVGFTLLHEGEIIFIPGCCCDLTNIENWEELLENEDDEWNSWRMVWIGHPWIWARFDQDRILITEPSEDHPNPPVPRYSVNADNLRDAVERADVIVQAFMQRVRVVLRDMLADR